MAQTHAIARLVIAWGSLAAFMIFGEAWLADLASLVKLTALLVWLFVVILWCAFGVVEQADQLAELLGEPLGTLVLTLSIVTVEVALIAAVMLESHAGPALGRDTMFAVLMIVLNGVVGLALLLGGLRHGAQAYNLQGAVAYLAIIVPLSMIALVLPSFLQSTSDGTLTKTQSFFFSLFTILLYGVFLAVQTVRHRTFFVEPLAAAVAEPKDDLRNYSWSSLGKVGRHTVLLIVTMLPIVLLAKQLAKLVDHGIAVLHAPPAIGGVLIALIVFTPEAMSALRAALDNQLQRSVNLCLGAASSTIGLTVPAILVIGLITGQSVVLGLAPASMVLLAITLVLSTITFCGPPTTILEGAVHLLLFFVYIVLIFSP
jgi:Ca2+:H+ antiporter